MKHFYRKTALTLFLLFSFVVYGRAQTMTATLSTESESVNGTFSVVVTFSEATTDFVSGEVTIGNGTLSNFTGSGMSYQFDVTPVAEGMVTIDVAAGVASNIDYTDSNAAAEQLAVDYDITRPAVMLATTQEEELSGSFILDVAFSEAITDFTEDDVLLENAFVSYISGDSSNMNYAVSITPKDFGPVSVQLYWAAVSDEAGNESVISESLHFYMPGGESNPKPEVESIVSGMTGVSPIPVQIAFNTEVEGFEASDITVTNGTVTDMYYSDAIDFSHFIGEGTGSGDGQLNSPTDVARDVEGNLYVVDQSNNRIVVFNAAGEYVRSFGSYGNGQGQFSNPYGITLDRAGNIYVADRFNYRVQVFANDGTFLRTMGERGWGPGQTYNYVQDVAVDQQGNIYLAAGYHILVFDYFGTYLRTIQNSGPGQFSNARQIVLDKDDRIYIADGSNDKVVVLENDGTFVNFFGGRGDNEDQFGDLGGIVINHEGNLLLTDPYNGSIKEFTTEGQFIATTEASEYALQGIAIDEEGNLYIAESNFENKIAVFQSTANYKVAVEPASEGEVTVAVAADVATDLEAQGNMASNVWTIEYEGTAPEAILSTAASGVQTSDFSVTFQFSETITDFTTEDIKVTNGTVATLADYDTFYVATITPTVDGTVTVDLPVDRVFDLAGNSTLPVTPIVVEADVKGPVVSFTASEEDRVKGVFQLTIELSEDVSDFTIGDLDTLNAFTSNFAGSGSNYTVDVTPSADGLVKITLPAGAITDAYGHINDADYVFSIYNDLTGPVAAITSDEVDDVTNKSPFSIFITPDEMTEGFTLADLNVTNGSASNLDTLFGAELSGSMTGMSGNYFDMERDAEGKLFVTNFSNQIEVFNADGTYAYTITYEEDSPGLTGITIDEAGNLYVADINMGDVKVFANDGTFLYSIGSQGGGQGKFYEPVGVEILNGMLYVTEIFEEAAVEVFSLDGTFQFSFFPNNYLPAYAEVGNGNLYIGDPDNSTVSIYSPDGTLLKTFGSRGSNPEQFSNMYNLHIYKQKLYVADQGSASVKVFDLEGDFLYVIDISTPNCLNIYNGQLYVADPTEEIRLYDFIDFFKMDITPAAEGTVRVELPEDTYSDLLGNLNTASTPFEIVYDATAPQVAITTNATAPVDTAFTVLFSFDERIVDFTIEDIIVDNATVSDFSGTDGDTLFTAVITPSADGLITVALAEGVFTDEAGNLNPAYDPFTIESEIQGPVVTMMAGLGGRVKGAFDLTIQLSEPVTDFEAADITVGNGAVSNFSGSSDLYTAEITPTAEGTVTVEVADSVMTDELGQPNLAAQQFTIYNDLTGPVISMTSDENDPTAASMFYLNVKGDEAIYDLQLEEVFVTNATKGQLVDRTESVFQHTMGSRGNGTEQMMSPWQLAVDTDGNVYVADMQNSRIQVFANDGTHLRRIGNTDPYAEDGISYPQAVAVDSGLVYTLTNNKVKVFDTEGAFKYAFTVSYNYFISAQYLAVGPEGNLYTTGMDEMGKNQPVVLEYTKTGEFVKAIEAAGMDWISGIAVDDNGKVYLTDGEESAVTNPVKVFNADGTFSHEFGKRESPTEKGFMYNPHGLAVDKNGDIYVADSQYQGTVQVFANDGTYKRTISGNLYYASGIAIGEQDMLFVLNNYYSATNVAVFQNKPFQAVELFPVADGPVTAEIAPASVSDQFGNLNADTATFSIYYETQAPQAFLSSSDSGMIAGAFNVDVRFTEDVFWSGYYDGAGVTITNGTMIDYGWESDSLYQFLIQPLADGPVSFSLAEGIAQDAAGNWNVASDTFTIMADIQGPVIELVSDQGDIVNSAFTLNMNLSEEATAFTETDIIVTNGTLSGFNGSGLTYTATVTPDMEGEVKITIPADSLFDALMQGNKAAVLSVQYDGTAPEVMFTSEVEGPVNVSPVPVEIRFSEYVKDFTAEDMVMTNANLANVQKHLSDLTPVSMFGSYGSEDGQFYYPYGIAADEAGNIYVADTDNERIQVFTTAGELKQIIEEPNGDYWYPEKIEVGPNGNLYVMDTDDYEIYILNKQGNLLHKVYWDHDVEDLKVDANGYIYTIDDYDYELRVYNPDGTFKQILVENFDDAYALELDAQGNIYVSDYGVMSVYANDGTLLRTFDIQVPGESGPVEYVYGMALGEDGTLYMGDEDNHRIVMFDTTGNFLQEYGSYGYAQGKFNYIYALDIDSKNNLYVLEEGNARVQVFSRETYYTADVEPIAHGLATMTIPAAAMTDAAHNENLEAVFSIDYDIEGPAVMITADQTHVTAPVNVNFSFSEEVTDFDESDINITGEAALSSFSGSGADYTIEITPVNEGLFTVNVADSAVTDALGNPGQASDTVEFFYDLTAPSAYTVAFDQDTVYPADYMNVSFTFANAEVGTQYNFQIEESGQVVEGSGTITEANQQVSGINVGFLNTGTLNLKVTLTDEAGNTGEETTDTVEKDLYSQAITFDALADRTYGDAAFDLQAVASSGLDVTYEVSDETVATISGSTLTILKAGTVDITASQAGDLSYHAATSVTQTLTINKAMLTVTADDYTMTYGDVMPELMSVSYEGFVNEDDASVLESRPFASISSTNAGIYDITVSGGSDNNYDFEYVTGTLTINKAMLTVTADDYSMTYGDATPELTFTYTGFVNRQDASVLDVAPVATVNDTNAGTHVINVSGGMDNNYDFEYVDGTLAISKAMLTVTADDQSATYGEATPELTLTYAGFAHAEDAAVLDVAPVATVNDTNAGAHAINVSGGQDNNYDFTYVDGTLAISKALLTVTANDQSATYGEATPELTLTYAGFAHAEDATVLDVAPVATTSGTDAGTYVINVSGGMDNNYDFEYVDGTLAISKAMLTVTANDQSVTYGEATPELTLTYAGFVHAEDAAVLDVAPVATTSGTDAGTYAINVSGGQDNNYDFTYVDGTLAISKALLTVTANDQSATYGEATPELTLTYAGFVHAEDATVLDVAPVATTSGTDAGTYVINVSGGMDNNYDFEYVDGTLAISKALLTVTANDQSATYGEATPELTLTYAGFVHAEDASVLDVAPVATVNDTNAGAHAINVSGGQDNNYDFTYVDGTLAISKALLTVTADDQTMTYGDVTPELSFSYTGFVNNEDASVLDVMPTVIVPGTDAGVYAITVSGGQDNNYDFTYVDGTLTINKVMLTVTADDQTRSYGEVTPELTVTYAGFVNEEDASVLDVLPMTTTEANDTSKAGTYTIMVEGGEDNNYDFSYVNGTLTITNDAPVFVSMADTTAYVDSVYTYNVEVQDVNQSDVLSITASTLPEWLTLTDNGDLTAVLTGTPAQVHVGEHAVVLEATDLSGTVVTQQFTILVQEGETEPFIMTTEVVEEAQVKAYPVPFTDELNLTLPTDWKQTKVRLVNNIGSVVLDTTINAGEKLDVSHLSEGVYIIQLIHGKQVKTIKVIK